jgi:hypothetical protein
MDQDHLYGRKMPLRTVTVANIVPNRWRDLNLYPIDEEQIIRLMSSIGDIGVFGAIPGRPTADGKIEQGCHHHLVEAARRCGIPAIIMEVQDRSDEQMLRLMIAENATQRGHNPASTMDSVNATVRHVAWRLFTETDTNDTQELLSVKNAGHAEIGEPLIQQYTPGLSLTEIRVALAALKASGYYSAAVADAIAEGQRQAQERIERLEQERREKEERAAREQEEAEKKRLEEEAAALRKQEETAAADLEAVNKAATKEAERKVTFDARVANLFNNPSQLETFRKLITTGDYAKYVPYDKQYQTALDIIEAARTWDQERENGQVTSALIRQYLGNLVLNGGIYTRQLHIAPLPITRFEEAKNLILDAESDLVEAAQMMAAAIRAGARVPELFHQFVDTRQAAFDMVLNELRSASGVRPGKAATTIDGEVTHP